jgi:hypothetical protein
MTDRIRLIASAATALLLVLIPATTLARRDDPEGKGAVARRSDIYCTGFISDKNPGSGMQVVGGIRENQKFLFSEGDKVFVNKGFDDHLQTGSVYQIIRSMGEFKHPFTGKSIGYLVREVGLLRVSEVNKKASIAQIVVSCEPVAFGDALRPYQPTAAPTESSRSTAPAESLHSADTREGKNRPTGQIVLSSRYQEWISANQIVYMDIGAKNGVQPGDHLTIFRKVGKSEGVMKFRDDEVVPRRERDLGSDRYRGGEYPSAATAEPHEQVLHNRPALPGKVVGQLVVLKVEGSTSVGLITRTSEPVNIGDYVERSN